MKQKKILVVLGILWAVFLLLVIFVNFQKPSNTNEKELLLEQAKQHYVDGDLESALTTYEKASLFGPDIRIDISLFTVYRSMGEFDLAEASLRRAIENDPARAQYWIDLAELKEYDMAADVATVSEVYESGLQATLGFVYNHTDLLTRYARFLEEHEDYAKAVIQLEKAQQLDPSRANIFEPEIVLLRKKAAQQ